MTHTPFYLDELNAHLGVRAHFIGRIAGVAVDHDREITVERLTPEHTKAVETLGYKWADLHRAEQIHGGDIKIVSKKNAKDNKANIWGNVDGLITADEGLLLGIYIADCGAVYLSDPVKGVIALLHSGKKGTEANIIGKAIAMMQEEFGSKPEDICAALAPCIRPPAYEVDFAAQIRSQVIAAGVPKTQFTDSEICTSTDLENNYSYRMEKGCTGRMLALLGR